MPKKQPAAIEARLQEAREARADAAARLEAGSGRAPRRPQSIDALRAKLAKRRGQMRQHAERGELRRWGIVPLAEAFSDEELAELFALDAEAQERRAAVRERHLQRQEVATMTRQVERERKREARQAAEAEARERLGVEG